MTECVKSLHCIAFIQSEILIACETTWEYLTRHTPMLNQDDFTALTLAAQEGNTSMISLLLNSKADVNRADNVRDPSYNLLICI